jgi:hypothetical protein
MPAREAKIEFPSEANGVSIETSPGFPRKTDSRQKKYAL